MKEKKHYSPEQKIIILRKLLENNIPISQVAEKYNVAINDIYNWKKKLFESAADGVEQDQKAVQRNRIFSTHGTAPALAY